MMEEHEVCSVKGWEEHELLFFVLIQHFPGRLRMTVPKLWASGIIKDLF